MAFRLKEAARERGLSLAALSRELGVHRANMSAIASGARGASLKVLNKISKILDIGMDELLGQQETPCVFTDKKLEAVLDNIEKNNYDGLDKSWVNRLMLAHNTHYKKARRGAVNG